MSDTTVIKPGHKIMRMLIEQDQDFAVELKANIVRTALKGNTIGLLEAETKSIILGESQKMFHELLQFAGFKKGSSGYMATTAMKEVIREEIISTVKDEVRKQAESMVQDILSLIKLSMDENVKKTINQEVKKKLALIAEGLTAQ